MRLSSNVYTRLKCAALLVSLTSFNLAPAFGLPSKNPLSKDWQLVAESNIVARAKIVGDLKKINEMQASKKSDDINLLVAVHEPVKGKVEKNLLTVSEYLGFDWFARRPSAMGKLVGTEVVVFLVYVDDKSGKGIYFTNRGSSNVRPFNKEDLLKLKSEVANQTYIVEHFKEFPIAKQNPSDKKVRSLLSQLTVDKTQDEAWEKLLKLPRSDTPALIRAMDDNRTLGHPQISIPNPPGPHRFEEIAHYGPKTILDAVSILLGNKTTTSFGQIYNGGSERERQTVLNAWRVWAYYNLSPGKSADSK